MAVKRRASSRLASGQAGKQEDEGERGGRGRAAKEPRVETEEEAGAGQDGDEGGKTEVLSYAEQRLAKMRQNEEMLTTLGLAGRESLEMKRTSGSGGKASGRGLRAQRTATRLFPARASSRLAGKTPEMEPVDDPEAIATGTSVPIYGRTQEPAATRLSEEPVSLEALNRYSSPTRRRSSSEAASMLHTSLQRLCSGRSRKAAVKGAKQQEGVTSDLSKLALAEKDVAKVVKQRAYSLAFHPSSHKLLCMSGDKIGHVGLWAVDGLPSVTDKGAEEEEEEEEEGEDGVSLFRPHLGAVSRIIVDPTDDHRVYTSSYDGTVRCLQIDASSSPSSSSPARRRRSSGGSSSSSSGSGGGGGGDGGQFNFVWGNNADEDIILTHCSMTPDASALFVSDAAGQVTCLDPRTPRKAVWTTTLHERKANSVDVNPTAPHLLATASLDRTVRLWDTRVWGSGGGGGRAVKPLANIAHPKSVNAAHWSPTGQWLLSVAQDDVVYRFKDLASGEGTAAVGEKPASKLAHSLVRHNNQTGRWLTKFQVAWDPKASDVWAIGSMERGPRRMQIYDCKSPRPVRELMNEEVMASVQSLVAFHPTQNVLAGVNSSGRVHVFR